MWSLLGTRNSDHRNNISHDVWLTVELKGLSLTNTRSAGLQRLGNLRPSYLHATLRRAHHVFFSISYHWRVPLRPRWPSNKDSRDPEDLGRKKLGWCLPCGFTPRCTEGQSEVRKTLFQVSLERIVEKRKRRLRMSIKSFQLVRAGSIRTSSKV
jgi:hypothetical protein